MNDGGIPQDPERITFDQPWGTVTIWAAGGYQSSTFVMNAYDSSNTLVGSSTVTTQDWQPLSVSYGLGIKYVELSESGGSAFIYDNLSNSAPVPIPATLLLFGPGLVGLAAIRRRFKK